MGETLNELSGMPRTPEKFEFIEFVFILHDRIGRGEGGKDFSVLSLIFYNLLLSIVKQIHTYIRHVYCVVREYFIFFLPRQKKKKKVHRIPPPGDGKSFKKKPLYDTITL